jgi:hypothetical protein
MAHTTTSSTHVAHPLARAAGFDLGIVVFTVGAVLVSFGTGQGAATWQNIALPPIVMVLAAVALWFAFVEIRHFWRTAAETEHRGSALFEVVVALIAMVVAGPMLLLMPWIFLGALT